MTGRHYLAVFALTAISLFLYAEAATSYEIAEVTNGGSLKGQVTLKGTPPKTSSLDVTKNTELCGTSKKNETLQLGSGGEVKNVVVTIEGVEQGKAFEKRTYQLDNKGCVFIPHVQVVPRREKLEIINSDPVLHNTHAYLGTATVFNLALPLQDQKIIKRMKRLGVMSIKCDAGHTWMSAYVVVVENPYYSVTDASGSFVISDIPPGTYQAKAWHEELGTEVQEIVVKGGEAVALSFSNLSK